MLLRAGIDPKFFDQQLEICDAHRNILGQSFNRYLHSEYCRHKGHLDIKTTKQSDKTMTQITYTEALASLQCPNLELPLGLPICHNCHVNVSKTLETVPMETDKASETDSFQSNEPKNWGSDPLNLQNLSEEINDVQTTRPVTRSHPVSELDQVIGADLNVPSVTRANPRSVIDQSLLEQVIGADPSPTVPYRPMKPARLALKANKEPKKKPHKLKIESLNQYMETCEEEPFPGHQHFKNLRFQDCKDPGRKLKVLKAMARTVKALLQTASESEEDSLVMWKELMDSGLVEKELCVEAQMSVELRAHVQLWNDATDYDDRIKMSAIMRSCYKYSAVNRFNKKPEASIAGEEATEIDVSKLEPNGLYFKPPITPYIWKQGGLHAKNGALSEVIREKIVRWKYDLEVVQSIQAFVNHPDVTQRVAYGTRLVKNPYGGTTEVANVIRTIPDAPLSRQVHDHLKAQQFTGNIPTHRTICVMLENMPASKTRSLEVRIREYY